MVIAAEKVLKISATRDQRIPAILAIKAIIRIGGIQQIIRGITVNG
jgi:hypothetical protein